MPRSGRPALAVVAALVLPAAAPASEDPWMPLEATEVRASNGVDLRRLADGSVLAEGARPD
ncbi:MAG: hypothetical protein ACF8XB_10505, partial [Planctomycetota bacterium JB042]